MMKKKEEKKMIVIHVKDFGRITVVLNRDEAPNTCANFTELVRKGFYDGLTFHRVIRGFMIQGGDPRGNGTGGPGYSIPGEFRVNGIDNTISHKRGVISMARAQDPDSAGSQFFIMHRDGEYLDGQYAAFGRVDEGIEVIDRIANVRTSPSDCPLTPVVIESIEAIDEPEIPVRKVE